MGGTPCKWPVGAALTQGQARSMDTVLHIGCHRSGTTTFQSYLRNHSNALRQKGVEFWDPRRTRGALFSGLFPSKPCPAAAKAQRRAIGRVQVNLAKNEQDGVDAVLVTDENMMGSVRANLRAGALYPAIGERMAWVNEAFDGRLTRVALVIRAQDRYWTSAVSYGVLRGHPVPSAEKLAQIANSPRAWRDVITDLACAMPDTEIRVIPFESYYGNPETLLETTCKLPTVRAGSVDWLNRTPTANELRGILLERGDDPDAIPPSRERWMPFNRAQLA